MDRTNRFVVVAGVAVFTVLGLGAVQKALSPFAGLRNPFQLHASAAATGPVVLQSVQKLNRLETCRYNGEVIVRGDNKGVLPVWLAGDKMLFVGRGEVVAGVDLAALQPADVQVQGDAVSMRLPKAEVFHSSLDNRQSQVHERQSGLFTGADPNLETQVRIEAEDEIRRAALESGVLKTARENAEDALRRHLETLGFRTVRFTDT